jgi:hypothetical protein
MTWEIAFQHSKEYTAHAARTKIPFEGSGKK